MDDQLYPGKSLAIASVICGIISCLSVFVYLFSGQLYICIPMVIAGFLGIIMGEAAKNSGYAGGLRAAGTIVSWVGAIIGAALCGILLFIALF